MKDEQTYYKIKNENELLKAEVAHLKEHIAYLERQLYGSKRDKLKKSQYDDCPRLFDDSIFGDALDEKAAEIEKISEEIQQEAKKRRQKSKNTTSRPKTYQYHGLEERVTVEYPKGINIDEMDQIGCDVTRILHIQKARYWVEVIERPIYRPKAERTTLSPTIYQAPTPNKTIGGNHVGADFLAQVVIDKYQYHIPEYRQIKKFADLGVKIPHSTLNNWVHSTASKLEPLYEALRKDILLSDYLQIDEVPWRIADSPGKTRKGYAWQFQDARPESHGLYFMYYQGSRAGIVPRSELKKYKGAIQTDGYTVYDYFEYVEGVTLLGCMAHVRRKFIEAQMTYPELAAEGVRMISLLYELEANLRDKGSSYEMIAKERKEKAIPIMETMEKWMERSSSKCTPADKMGKALDYAYKLWPRLKRYAEDGRYQIDNNSVERAQRPSVMGRKNYLFSKNDNGAIDNAIFYSLIESCEIVGINPLEYLTYVLDKLNDGLDDEEIKSLLPYYHKKAR